MKSQEENLSELMQIIDFYEKKGDYEAGLKSAQELITILAQGYLEQRKLAKDFSKVANSYSDLLQEFKKL